MSLLHSLAILLLAGHISYTGPTDTIKKITIDDFPVTDKMLGRDMKGNAREITSGKVVSIDKVWFTNDSLGQTLVFELYTDNFRMNTFLFSNNNIPKGLIKIMELHTAEGQLAGEKEKSAAFKGFIRQARKIRQKYFVSDKGFALGSTKEKAVSIYGKPTATSGTGEIEMLQWQFTGDILYDGRSSLHGRPLARDSYGNTTTMFFVNDKLIGMVLQNDIP
jgi:hypothetical protein